MRAISIACHKAHRETRLSLAESLSVQYIPVNDIKSHDGHETNSYTVHWRSETGSSRATHLLLFCAIFEPIRIEKPKMLTVL